MKLIKNKNEIVNNIDVDKDNVIIVTREVAEKLDAIIGTQAPEKGGFLFENNGVVDEFCRHICRLIHSGYGSYDAKD